MKRSLPLVAVLFFISCNSKNSSKQILLTAQNLKSVFIVLNPDSAYNLKTPKGAILKIAKNSFDIKANEKIRLEIKEAYSAGDILLAGLTTKSNGKLLQSGGMIYINATANDKTVKIAKPISVSIPSEVYDKRMQLFKGEIEDDSNINWVDPKPLDTAPAAKKIINGEILFKANCASCHKPTIDFTAPPLAYCRDREPDRDWAYRFTVNSSQMRETEAYAKAIFSKWNKIQMTAFPNITKAAVEAILDYCDNEARLNPVKLPATVALDSLGNQQPATPCFDSGFYPLPDTNIKVLPVDTMPGSTGILSTAERTDEIPMYQFNIDQLGWYNIDFFIDANQALVTDVSLTAGLKMPKGLNVEVYLCIPDRKLLTSGIEMQHGEYQFYKEDGSIPLILNDEAVIIALGSDKSKTFYGISRFRIQNKQHIVVNLIESTKEDILNALKSNKLGEIKIEINKPETYVRGFSNTDSSTASDTSKQKMQMQIFEIPCYKTDSTRQISWVKK